MKAMANPKVRGAIFEISTMSSTIASNSSRQFEVNIGFNQENLYVYMYKILCSILMGYCLDSSLVGSK